VLHRDWTEYGSVSRMYIFALSSHSHFPPTSETM